jgi:diguanylate cyclase (GGDEF)-like protein
MTTILACLSDEGQRRAWENAFQQCEGEVFYDLRDLAADRTIDIVIQFGTSDALHGVGNDPRYIEGHTAVIAIGPPCPADLALPEDVTPRELAMACKLISEIVNLRGQRSESQRARGHLRDLAYTDSLTNIANRRSWDEELHRREGRPRGPKGSWGVALLDLDRFKEVNDRYGHATGDQVLKRAAHAIAAGIRVSDFAARLGGDEFGLLLADVDSTDAACVVERIRRAIATRCSEPTGPNISASAGFAITLEQDTCEAMFERADTALRHAKEAGRDRTLGY